MVRVSHGGRRVAIRADEYSAAYTGMGVARRERAGRGEPVVAVRVVVELSRAFGGMRMRALLGGEFSPTPLESATVFEVSFGEPMGLGAVAHCGSELGGPLVAGLPCDFVDAVLDGLAADDAAGSLPAGLLRVDRAGFDEVGSSELAFTLAAGLLRHVVDAVVHGDDPTVVARGVLSRW